MKTTILQQIVNGLKDRLTVLEDSNGQKLFNNVIEGTPDFTQPTTWPCIGVDQSKEETVRMMEPYVDKECTFFLEFCFARYDDIDPYEKFRYYEAELQRALFGSYDDMSIGGLATESFQVSSNPQIEGRTDPAPGGLMEITVRYRHRRGNPYSQE